MTNDKPCVCLDKDEYSCYYLRLRKVSKSRAEKWLELGDDTTYCYCKCHAEQYKGKISEDMVDVFFTDWLTRSRF